MPLAATGADTGVTAEALKDILLTIGTEVDKVTIFVPITVEGFFDFFGFNVPYMVKLNVEIPAES